MLRPLRGFVLIEPIKDSEKTSIGVYVPESAKDKPMKGKVIAVGNPITRHPTSPNAKGSLGLDKNRYTIVAEESPVDVNDIVYYKKWANDEVKIEGKEYVFVKFGDILGIEDNGTTN